jgi:hypothetical protein
MDVSCKSRDVRFVSDRNSEGIEPFIAVNGKFSSSSWVKPISVGIEPEIILLPSLRRFSFTSWPTSEGMDPDMKLGK